ncbi:MAG: cellulase family glycosylhydrolase [Lachnospiraceae bacterium]|nr:cellulase family glycosylhydrolase [Lachnospiraceae bacterium]
MKLYRGINFGGYLSQCEHTLDHYATFITKEDVKKVKDLGFDHIRLPIDYEVLETREGIEYTEGIAYVNQFLLWCEEYEMDVVLDLHKAYGYDFNDAGDPSKNNLFANEELQKRFVDLWTRLAQHYGKLPYVAFELLNEVVEEHVADNWNKLIDVTVNAIRRYAPDTPIIYGGIQWNSARTLKLLNKPEDDNIIFTFHMYEPLIFTHQKAHWVPNMPMDKTIEYPATMEYYKEMSALIGYKGKDVTVSECKEMGKPFLIEMVSEAVEAARKVGVKLYCGEFGVIDRAPVEDTLRWYRDIFDVFKQFDIHAAVWSYKEMDFGVTDEHYAPIADELFEILTT